MSKNSETHRTKQIGEIIETLRNPMERSEHEQFLSDFCDTCDRVTSNPSNLADGIRELGQLLIRGGYDVWLEDERQQCGDVTEAEEMRQKWAFTVELLIAAYEQPEQIEGFLKQAGEHGFLGDIEYCYLPNLANKLMRGWEPLSQKKEAIRHRQDAPPWPAITEQVEAETAEPIGDDVGKLPRHIEFAYRSFELAAAEEWDHEPTDREYHDWLKENGPADYGLPIFHTWVRYVRKGREHYGTRKNIPRGGRTGRSMVMSEHVQTRRDDGHGDD